MKQFRAFAPFFTFKQAQPAERQGWTDAFMHIVRKLTVRHGASKRLVVKSPVHTARIALLLELFPDAQFVYIHRHPYEVFRSAVNMADKTYWYSYLNTPSDDDIMEFILSQYEILYDSYIEVCARTFVNFFCTPSDLTYRTANWFRKAACTN
jgi:hypothetical protein